MKCTLNSIKIDILILSLLFSLEDFHEKRVIEKQAERITPLVTTPGRVVLTDARLYFQPFSATGPVCGFFFTWS